MIDMLRIKDENRGFCGKTLKKPKAESSIVINLPQNESRHQKKTSSTDVISFIKRNHRDFTAVRSCGLTRYEKLTDAHVYDLTLQEILRAHDSYSKDHSSKDDIDRSSLTKLPNSPRHCVKTVEYTGFTVKSYQNPHPAQILATFPSPRPGTVPLSHSFLSYRQSSSRSGVVKPQPHPFSGISGSTKTIPSVAVRPCTTIPYEPPTSLNSYTQPATSAQYQKISGPSHSRPHKPSVSFKSNSVAETDHEARQSPMNGETDDTKPMVINMKKAEVTVDEGCLPASPTMFVVEDEDGIMKHIELEETTQMDVQSNKLQRQESEEIMAVIKENAEQRQRKFAKLLDEHKEIVQEIGRISSSDCIVTQTARD